jgi:hypothetical protein
MPKLLINNSSDGGIEESSLALTVADNGGAVILQAAASSTYQSGRINLETTSAMPVARFVSHHATEALSVANDGVGVNAGPALNINSNTTALIATSSGGEADSALILAGDMFSEAKAMDASAYGPIAFMITHQGAADEVALQIDAFGVGLLLESSSNDSSVYIINAEATGGAKGLKVSSTAQAAYFIGSSSAGAVQIDTAAAQAGLIVNGTNTINTNPTLKVDHDGLGTGIRIESTGTGLTIVAASAGTGFSAAAYTQTGTGRGVLITSSNSSNGTNALQVDYAGTEAAGQFNATNNAGTPVRTNTTSNTSTEYGLEMTATNAAGAIKVTTGSGSTRGPVMSVVQNSGTERFRIEDSGSIFGDVSPNYLLNGAFQIWQRGPAATFSIPSGVDNKFTADRWAYNKNGTGTGSIVRVAFTPGHSVTANNPILTNGAIETANYLRHTRAVAGTGATTNLFYQKIPNVRTLAGKKATLSFWAKADASRQLSIVLRQVFGAGGSTAVSSAAQVANLTTAWQKFILTYDLPSIDTKTVGTGGDDNLSIRIEQPLNTTFTIEYALFQLEEGPIATPFRFRTFEDERIDCLPFFQKSFAYATAPAQNAGTAGATFFHQVLAASTGQNSPSIPFIIPMRATPTVTIFNPNAASAQVQNATRATAATGTTVNSNSSDRMFIINYTSPAAPAAVGDIYSAHWTAEAELF